MGETEDFHLFVDQDPFMLGIVHKQHKDSPCPKAHYNIDFPSKQVVPVVGNPARRFCLEVQR